jgi:pimeloyl-ACP methyl ester carboxylesterase
VSGSRVIEHHSVELKGIKQHYVKAGNGPAVMLLHGWPQTWYEWRRVIDLLDDKFTIIAPDLRGFGYTSKHGDRARLGCGVRLCLRSIVT